MAASTSGRAPGVAFQNAWDLCSRVAVNSAGTKRKLSLAVSGSCDGGSRRLTWLLNSIRNCQRVGGTKDRARSDTATHGNR